MKEITLAIKMVMIWGFTASSTVLKSYQANGRVILKGSMQ